MTDQLASSLALSMKRYDEMTAAERDPEMRRALIRDRRLAEAMIRAAIAEHLLAEANRSAGARLH